MDDKSQKRLFLCLLAIIGILLAEVIGGVMSNSLALVSDVGHVWKCWHGSGGWGMGYQYYRRYNPTTQ